MISRPVTNDIAFSQAESALFAVRERQRAAAAGLTLAEKLAAYRQADADYHEAVEALLHHHGLQARERADKEA